MVMGISLMTAKLRFPETESSFYYYQVMIIKGLFFEPLFKADTIGYTGILAIVGNDLVAAFFIKRNGLRLFIAGFQYTAIKAQFGSPLLQLIEDLKRHFLSTMLRLHKHALYFHGFRVQLFDGATPTWLIIQISHHGIFDLIYLIELMVKRMVPSVSDGQVGIQLADKFYEISMLGVGAKKCGHGLAALGGIEGSKKIF